MFKYNFNNDKYLKYELKRCLEYEPIDTLEDVKFKKLIAQIDFLNARDINILVGHYTMYDCLECSFNWSTFCIMFKIFINNFNITFGDFLVTDKESVLYHNNGISAPSFIPSAEYSFCTILAIAAKKASTKEIKNLWRQKINGGK